MNPVIVIGLDAAEQTLVRRFMAEGAMPTLAALTAQGAMTPLWSSADAFAGAVWPSLFYGVEAGAHGIFGGYPIVPGRYAVRTMDAHVNAYAPFFVDEGERPLSVIALDVPKSRVVRAPGTAMLVAWGSHAPRADADAWPRALGDEVVAAVGRYPLALLAQEDDVHTEAYYRGLRERLLAGVRARTALHRHMLARGEPELFFTVFSELHVVGHRFWHFMDEAHAWHDPDASPALKGAVRDVYAAVDAAIAELLAMAPRASEVLVVSSHGMQPSRHLPQALPRVLERLLPPADRARARVSLASHAALAARRLAPPPLRAALKQHVPSWLRQRVRARYLEAAFGISRWPTQRAFCTPSEDHGYVRVNVSGREPAGLVEAGAEREDLLASLAEELAQLVDADTGERVVEAFVRPQERYPGPHAARMPDLVVRFTAGSPTRRLASPRLGALDVRAAIVHRSAEHHPEGFVIARGAPTGGEPAPNVVDIGPTVLALLGREQPAHLVGRALDAIVRARAAR